MQLLQKEILHSPLPLAPFQGQVAYKPEQQIAITTTINIKIHTGGRREIILPLKRY